jgi:hypothetical protein
MLKVRNCDADIATSASPDLSVLFPLKTQGLKILVSTIRFRPSQILEHPDKIFYSVRSAVIGFTCVARRAGRKQARRAAMVSITLEVIRANGSLGLT